MHEDETRADVARWLEATRPELTPALQARAVAAMEAAQARPARPRRRLVAIVTMAVVVLAGLGFVPIPLGSTKGALDRAVAAASNARTVHIVTRTPGGTTEEWLAEEGFDRRETRSEGRLTGFSLVVGPWETDYSYNVKTGRGSAESTFDPCLLHPAHLPDRAAFQRQFEEIRYTADLLHEQAPEVRSREYRQASLWGGEVAVIEARAEAASSLYHLFNGTYRDGDGILVRAELDPATDSLLSVREYRLSGREQELTHEATYEWNVEIPEELKHLDLPEGTKVSRFAWWETRAEKAIAQAATRDWLVTLHAIDINRRGDLLLSVSRAETPGSQMPSVYNGAPPLAVEAQGSGGERYEQQNGYSCSNARHAGYWTTTLEPESESSQPASITLTIRPYAHGPSEGQSVTFRNVPLPPRQDVDDVMAASREVGQE
jgi:hypothetical protein